MDILFYSHLGLGDQISINGAVHYLHEIHKCRIYIVCKKQNFSNINYLYKDYSYAIPMPIDNKIASNYQEALAFVNSIAKNKNLKIVSTSIDNPLRIPWDKDHFSKINIPIEVKLSHSKRPIIKNSTDIIDKHGTTNPYAFIHDHPKYPIREIANKKLKIIRNPIELNIFETLPLLENACEIHLTNSSILCMCEVFNLPLENQKGFYYSKRGRHNYGRIIQISNQSLWKIIDHAKFL